MPEPFVVAFVVGVTPGKWARVWGERRPRHPLTLNQLGADAALAALRDGTAHVALLRLPLDHDDLSSITLYEELAVVVSPKDHVFEEAESITLADLAEENVLDGDWATDVELVASNVGVAVMPQSVARALSRRDVAATAVTDAPVTRVALAWLTAAATDDVDEFIGIVRGRTANSSRGQQSTPEPPPKAKPRVKPKPQPTSRRKKPKLRGR